MSASSSGGSRSSWRRSTPGPPSAWFPPRPLGESVSRLDPRRPSTSGNSRRRTNHDLAAFVDAVGAELDAEGRRWLHYGLTSSDVVDTALSLQIGEAGALLRNGIDRAQTAVVGRAEEHRTTLMIGRTHGVHAEPTTFGLKLAGWAFELERGRARLERRARGNAGRQALRCGRHIRGDRSRARADRL